MHPELISYFGTRHLGEAESPCFPKLHEKTVSGLADTRVYEGATGFSVPKLIRTLVESEKIGRGV